MPGRPVDQARLSLMKISWLLALGECVSRRQVKWQDNNPVLIVRNQNLQSALLMCTALRVCVCVCKRKTEKQTEVSTPLALPSMKEIDACSCPWWAVKMDSHIRLSYQEISINLKQNTSENSEWGDSNSNTSKDPNRDGWFCWHSYRVSNNHF